MRRLTFVIAMAILLAGVSVHAQKGVPIEGGAYDYGVQDDNNGYYMLFSSVSGEYEFERCSDGVEFQGKGKVTVEGCTLTLEEVGFNRYVLVQVNLCEMSGKCLVRVFKGLKTDPYVPPMLEILSDSNMLDNTWDCKGEKP